MPHLISIPLTYFNTPYLFQYPLLFFTFSKKELQKTKPMNPKVRVRFAPSPTGLLHIGGLRTALYNYLFARHHGGAFVLRIEDTDQARYVQEAEQDMLESLAWAGLHPDEGPYHQSSRRERYAMYAQQLVDDGYAYYAYDTVEEIEKMRERLRSPQNPNPKYDSQTRMQMRNSLTLGELELQELLEEGSEYVVRLKVPQGETVQFEDMVRGPVSFETDGLDDQVLLKADGMPTYHLANVVDDHEMEITHVIRGEEWLSSAPKHILLYKYLGWEPPVMAHLPLIMSPSGGKLSKRKAEEEGIPVNVRDYRKERYERDAVINFLALLGWSPGDDRELLTLEEMTREFTLGRVGKSGAIFDFKKLLWFNENYMRQRADAELAEELMALVRERGLPGKESLTEKEEKLSGDSEFMAGVVRLLKERVSRLPEFLEAGIFFFDAPVQFDEKAVKKGWKEDTPPRIIQYRDRISGLEGADFRADELKRILTEIVEAEGVGFGKLMMPLRVAVTGAGSGPDLFETLELLGRDEVLGRLDRALQKFA